MSVLPHIRSYRELLKAFDSGKDLGMAEVLKMEHLASLLRRQAEESAGPTISALVTHGSEEHSVQLTRLGPDQVTCIDCPRILPGTSIGLRLDECSDDASYLFRTVVTASNYNVEAKQWTLKLSLIGAPVVLNWARGRAPSSDAVLRLEENMKAA